MTDRERQTVALLRLVDEWVPCPRLSRVYRSAERGSSGPDSYLSDRSSSFAAAAGDDRHAVRRRRDGELRRLELAREHEAGRVDARELEPWEAARAELDALGSFRELRAALDELCSSDPFGWTCVRLVYGFEAELRQCGPSITAAAEEGVSFIAGRLPDPIRVPGPREAEVLRAVRGGRGWLGVKERHRQNAEIRRLDAAGVKQEAIATQFGLSQPQVSKIVRAVVGEGDWMDEAVAEWRRRRSNGSEEAA